MILSRLIEWQFKIAHSHCNWSTVRMKTPHILPRVMEVIMLFEFCSKWLCLKLSRFYSSQTLIEVISALCISSKFLLYFLPLRHTEVCWLLSLMSGREEWKGNHFRKQLFVFLLFLYNYMKIHYWLCQETKATFISYPHSKESFTSYLSTMF